MIKKIFTIMLLLLMISLTGCKDTQRLDCIDTGNATCYPSWNNTMLENKMQEVDTTLGMVVDSSKYNVYLKGKCIHVCKYTTEAQQEIAKANQEQKELIDDVLNRSSMNISEKRKLVD